MRIAFFLTAVFAFGSAVYSAFLFGQAKGRDFWQSPLFSVHLVVMALLAGSAMMLILDDSTPGVRQVFYLSLILHGGLIAFDLTAPHSTHDAKISARSVYRKNLLFWLGAIAVDILLPLILIRYDITAAAGQVALIGLLIYEKIWVKVGQIVPLS